MKNCPRCGSEDYISCTIAEQCNDCGYEADYR